MCLSLADALTGDDDEMCTAVIQSIREHLWRLVRYTQLVDMCIGDLYDTIIQAVSEICLSAVPHALRSVCVNIVT